MKEERFLQMGSPFTDGNREEVSASQRRMQRRCVEGKVEQDLPRICYCSYFREIPLGRVSRMQDLQQDLLGGQNTVFQNLSRPAKLWQKEPKSLQQIAQVA